MSNSQPAPPSETHSETSPAGGLPRVWVVAGIAAIWGGLFYGALQISNMKLGYWKFMCGPWGCLPETAPLVSVHAMWLTFLFGAIWLARLSIPILQSAKLWFVLAGVTLLGLSIYLGVDLARNWSPRYGPAEICKRSIYATMILTDLPFCQLVFCFVANGLACWFKRTEPTVSPDSPDPELAS